MANDTITDINQARRQRHFLKSFSKQGMILQQEGLKDVYVTSVDDGEGGTTFWIYAKTVDGNVPIMCTNTTATPLLDIPEITAAIATILEIAIKVPK